jgi:hypothetical protein
LSIGFLHGKPRVAPDGGAAAEAIDKLGELIGCDMPSPSPWLKGERQERLNPESMFMFSTLINVSEPVSMQFMNGAHVLFREHSFVCSSLARLPSAAPLRVFT